MRNLTFLVLLGLGISCCIYYFSTDTQATSSIPKANIGEGIAYTPQEQSQQSLSCISTKNAMSTIHLDENSNAVNNAMQEPNPGINRRALFLGQSKLQKLMHQHKSENCACTMPNNDEMSKKKLSTPPWLRILSGTEGN